MCAVFPHSDMPLKLLLYFQHILPLTQCTAEDGRVVGHLLIDVVHSKPKDLARAIHEFANRTAMLRECCVRYIGSMLVALLTAEIQTTSECATIHAQGPASLTEEEAVTIGSWLGSSGLAYTRAPDALSLAVKKLIETQLVLRNVAVNYVWFVPMLEVLMMQKAERNHSTTPSRLFGKLRRGATYGRSIVTPEVTESGAAPTDVCPSANAYGADASDASHGDGGCFNSLIPLGVSLEAACICERPR